MLRYAFFAAIALGSFVSFQRWRLGFFFMIVIGVLQDPIRKVTHGTPAYLVLCTVPIWFTMILGALRHRKQLLTNFESYNPRLLAAIQIFALALIPGTIISATYGAGSWKLTLIGLFAYASPGLGLLLGFNLAKNARGVERVLPFYCVVTAIMLSGVVMEQFSVFPSWRALGTEALGTRWIRTRTGYAVLMKSGFYRSPDVMGWHAATLSMLAIALALKHVGIRRWIWVAVAGWGGLGLMFCGRRKMMLMVPLYVMILFWSHWRLRRRGQIMTYVVIVIAVVVIGYMFSIEAQVGEEVGTYYFMDTGDVIGRLYLHGVGSVIYTIMGDAGILGLGLGTATQGAHHLDVDKPRTWQEGGISKVSAELGLFGLICFGFLAVTLAWTMRENLILTQAIVGEEALFAGLIAFFFANIASFIVSAQVFGDPFINCTFAMLSGLGMSRSRMNLIEPAPRQRHPTPPAFLPRRALEGEASRAGGGY